MRHVPALFAPAPIRKRLWQAAIAVALLVGTFLVGNFIIHRDRAVTSDMLGHDFLPFYAAGTFARSGEFHLLYNLAAIKQFEHQLARYNHLEINQDTFGPFWNPPFYAWVFAPLSTLPYRTARDVWMGLNLLALGGAIVLLCRMLPPFARDWRATALVPLLLCVSMPFIQALSHGQNTFTSLLLLTIVVTAWRARWDVTAGLVCGMMFYKPQLAAVIAVMLIVSRGMRVCIGLGFTLGMLCLVTSATMPNAIGDYLHQLPLNVHLMQVQNEYLWERHVTFKGLWRLLLQGRGAGEASILVQVLTWTSCAAIGAGLLWTAWRERRAGADDIFTGETGFIRRDRFIAATIAAMPLLMPFYFDYDLLLLSVPAVLFAGEVLMFAPGRPMERGDRLLLWTWCGLYAWLMFNSLLAKVTGVNITVILLAAAAFLLIKRAGRQIRLQHFAMQVPQVIRVTARRAA